MVICGSIKDEMRSNINSTLPRRNLSKELQNYEVTLTRCLFQNKILSKKLALLLTQCYREADLRLCFRLCRLLVFPWGGSYVM